ncbi:MAG: UDP-2,3-diacylglucosamine diphosphatase [Phycisphaerae bacterium]|nr:UDP-2,3-diacylglucosamine diphosphatase [Phycisphaerae bacterium]
MSTPPHKRFYRSVWISDAHLCSKDARADLLYTFLDSIKVDYLYLVGDIVDVWALRQKWHWPPQYNEVIHKLLKRSRKGARVFYIPGNHDDFFRSFVGYQFGDVRIVSDRIHETADGRRFLVLHGDEFDSIVLYRRWLSHLGSWAYRYLIAINRMVNWVRRLLGRPYWSLSGAIKRKVQSAVKHLTSFEQLLTAEARHRRVDGVICGHTHQPAIHEIEGILYCNTGDWIESCTALVEHADGRIELVWWAKEWESLQAEGLVDSALPFGPGRSEAPWGRHLRNRLWSAFSRRRSVGAKSEDQSFASECG